MLEERKDNGINPNSVEEIEEFLPFKQTNILVDEISNLKLKHLTNGGVTVEKVLSKVDKDRFSSLMYGLWWAMAYDNKIDNGDNEDLILKIAQMNRAGRMSVSNSINSLFM